MHAVESCLSSTTSTQGDSTLFWVVLIDSPVFKFAMIASPLDELSHDNHMTVTEITGHPIVTFIIINKSITVDDTDNEIEYINTNPLNLEQPLTIMVKQVLDQSWLRGKRTSTYGAAAKLVMRILTCLFIYLTHTQEVQWMRLHHSTLT